MKSNSILTSIILTSMLAVFAYADTSTYTVTSDTYVVVTDSTPYTPPEPAPPPVWKPPRWVSKPIPATPIEKNNARVEIKHIFSSPCEQRFGITIKNTGLSTKYADIRAILSDTNFDLKDAEIEIKRWTHTLAPARWIKAKKIDEAIYKQKKYQYIGNHRIPANEVRYYEVIIRYPVQRYKDGWGGKGLLTLKIDNDEFKDTKHSSWWDNDWDYRREIKIYNSTSAQTNYQVFIATTDFGSDWDDIMSKAQDDMDDFRFTSSTGVLLDYWIEDNTTTPKGFWSEVNYLTATDTTTVYIYYGNATASAGSNGDDTFELFDDFEDGTIDSDKWNYDSQMSEEDGYFIVTSQDDYDHQGYSKQKFGIGYLFKTYAYVTGG